MHYSRVERFLSVSRITGPKHNILQLEVNGAGCGTPAIERLGPSDANSLSEEAVVAAVMEGVAAANERFARDWRVSRMRYAPADSAPETVYAHLAYSILATWEAGGYGNSPTTLSAAQMDEPRSVEALFKELDAMPEDDSRAPLLIELLARGEHERHEDIVFELGLIGAPTAVDAILKAAQEPFAYLEEWGNLHEFQRKCAYALARIGIAESRTALEQLASAADPYLREYGEEGLEHWPMPFRAR